MFTVLPGTNLIPLYLTNADDWYLGLYNTSQLVYGDAGNDFISLYDGDDYIDGGGWQ